MKYAKTVCFAAILFSFLMITVFPQTVCQAKANNVEIQTEYLMHRIYARRFIDNYNVHIFQKAHEHAGLTFHRGLTFTRPTAIPRRMISAVTVTRWGWDLPA